MLGPSHKRRRSGHRCWDPVTRGGGQSTDAGTQSQEEKRSSPKQSGIQGVEVGPVISEEVQSQTKWHPGSGSWPSDIRRGTAPNKVASREWKLARDIRRGPAPNKVASREW
ncbi:hypothetical protein MAR_016245, partial [Mya arenaria]